MRALQRAPSNLSCSIDLGIPVRARFENYLYIASLGWSQMERRNEDEDSKIDRLIMRFLAAQQDRMRASFHFLSNLRKMSTACLIRGNQQTSRRGCVALIFERESMFAILILFLVLSYRRRITSHASMVRNTSLVALGRTPML
jgi:hypothetical protein